MSLSRAEEKELLAFRQAPLPISITTAIIDVVNSVKYYKPDTKREGSKERDRRNIKSAIMN